MKNVQCQGKSFITTDDVAHAIANFSDAARRRGRIVRVDVPIVPENCESVVELVLAPGETLDISESSAPQVELDTAPLIRSLTARRLAWLPHKSPDAASG